MNTFPIPASDAWYSDMIRRVKLQTTALQGPLEAIGNEIGARLNYGDKILRSITSRLNRTITSNVKKNDAQLEKVTSPVLTNILASSAENAIALNGIVGKTVINKSATITNSGQSQIAGINTGNIPTIISSVNGPEDDPLRCIINDPRPECHGDPIDGPFNLWIMAGYDHPSGYAVQSIPIWFEQPGGNNVKYAENLSYTQVQDHIFRDTYLGIRLCDMLQLGMVPVPECPANPPPPVEPPLPPVEPPVYPPVEPPSVYCPPSNITCPSPIVTCPQPIINVNVPPTEPPTCPPQPPVEPPVYPPVLPPGGPGGPTVYPPVQPPTYPPLPPGSTGTGSTGILGGPILYNPGTMQVGGWSNQLQLPLPGSAEFCKLLESAANFLTSLGDVIVNNLADDTTPWKVMGSLSSASSFGTPLGMFGGLIPNIINVINSIAKYSEGFYKVLKQIVGVIKQTGAGMMPCNPGLVIGINVVRCVIRALEHVRFGTDLAVWLTADFTFDIPQLETIVDYVNNYVCRVEIPGPYEAIDAYINGYMSRDMLDCWLKMKGCDPIVWEPAILSHRQKPTNEQMIIWAKRQQMTPEQVKEQLELRGFTEPEDRDIMEKISWYAPTISDMLHFIQRNVYDTKYIQDFKLLEDFDEKVWKEFQPELYQIGMSKKYAEWWYAGHWMNPSPTQLYEMVQRLRPNRVDPNLVFTATDAMRVMVEQDIAPYFRARFLKIAYKTFGLRFLRQLYDTYSIPDDELQKRFQDIGYEDKDATILLDSERQMRAWRRSTRTKGWSPTTIAWAVQRGLIEDGDAERLCKQLYLTDNEIHDLLEVAKLKGRSVNSEKCKQKAMQQYVAETEKLFEIGAIPDSMMKSTLIAAGYDDRCVDIRVSTLKLKVKRTNYQQLIMAIKKALLRGVYTIEQAINRMVGAGISNERAMDYISYWLPDFTPERKKASADKAIKWYEEGLIDEPTVISRLHNLGFDDIDTLLYVSQAKREILEREVKRQQTIEKGIASKQKELERLARQAEAQLTRIRNELRKLYPVSRLQTWLKKGLISADNMAAKLRGQGYPAEAIDNYIKEVSNNGQQ